MAGRRTQTSLFGWVRGARSVRLACLVAALMLLQGPLACAFEPEVAPGAVQAASDSSDGDCCALCINCNACGGCHAPSAAARNAEHFPAHADSHDVQITWATSASTLWTPPTPLRPPIQSV
jgi:hypothetical protein